MKEKTIESILEETRQFPPSKKFSSEANISKEELILQPHHIVKFFKDFDETELNLSNLY